MRLNTIALNSLVIALTCFLSGSALATDRGVLIDELTREMAMSAGKTESEPIRNTYPATKRGSDPKSLSAAASLKGQVSKSRTSAKVIPTEKQSIKETIGTRTASGSRTIGYVSVCIALMVLSGIAFWLKRRARAAGVLGNVAKIETLATTRLAGKHAISLVRVAGRLLVVGVGDNGLTLLTELDEEDMSSHAAAPEPHDRDAFVNKLMGLGFNEPAPEPKTSSFMSVMDDGDTAPADELLSATNERAAIRERLTALRRRVNASKLSSMTAV